MTDSNEIISGVHLKGGVPGSEVGGEFTHKGKRVITSQITRTYNKEIPRNDADTSAWSVSVGFEEKADSYATANLSFGAAMVVKLSITLLPEGCVKFFAKV